MTELLDHQKASVAKMRELYEKDAPFIILNDPIGSGKTITFLSFWKDLEVTCVVVTTVNNIGQWQRDFEKLGISYHLHGTGALAEQKLVLMTDVVLAKTSLMYNPHILCFDGPTTMPSVQRFDEYLLFGKVVASKHVFYLCGEDRYLDHFETHKMAPISQKTYVHLWQKSEDPFVKLMNPSLIHLHISVLSSMLKLITVRNEYESAINVITMTHKYRSIDDEPSALSIVESHLADAIRETHCEVDAVTVIQILIEMKVQEMLQPMKEFRAELPFWTEVGLVYDEKLIEQENQLIDNRVDTLRRIAADRSSIETELREECTVCCQPKDLIALYVCCRCVTCWPCSQRLESCPKCRSGQIPIQPETFIQRAINSVHPIPSCVEMIKRIIEESSKTLIVAMKRYKYIPIALGVKSLIGTKKSRSQLVEKYTNGDLKAMLVAYEDVYGMRLEVTSDIVVFKVQDRYRVWWPGETQMAVIRGCADRMGRKNDFPLNIHVMALDDKIYES